MEAWLTVLVLLVVGLILVIIELIFIPGTTIVGIFGFIFSLVGIYLGFSYFGSSVGWLILGGSALITVITVIYSFKSGVWERFALKNAINSRVNEGQGSNLVVGDEGVATSTLKPIGKAEFGNTEYEVSTIGNYVENGHRVKIIKIEVNKIFVEIINQ